MSGVHYYGVQRYIITVAELSDMLTTISAIVRFCPVNEVCIILMLTHLLKEDLFCDYVSMPGLLGVSKLEKDSQESVAAACH